MFLLVVNDDRALNLEQFSSFESALLFIKDELSFMFTQSLGLNGKYLEKIAKIDASAEAGGVEFEGFQIIWDKNENLISSWLNYKDSHLDFELFLL